MKKTNRIRSIVTILTVVALLLMIMPMSVMAKGNDKKNPAAQASEKAAREQKSKAPEVKNNPKAQFIAERNEWAKANGLPPGYANIMYKYLVTSDQLAAVTKDAVSVTTAMEGLKTYFTSFTPAANPTYFNADGTMNIKVFMSAIKQLKLVAEEEDLELPEVEEEEEEEEDEGEEDEGAEEAPAPAPEAPPAPEPVPAS